MVARLVQALALGAWQGAANRAVPQQVVVGGEQPDLPQFCHTDIDAQHAAGDSAKAPSADPTNMLDDFPIDFGGN